MTASSAAPGRNREDTESRLLAAVGEVLAREGFAALGVNAVAKQAGVDKVLIYRYFGGLPGLVQAWGSSGRFWPDLAEVIGADGGADLRKLPLPERYARFFDHFIDSLRKRPLTLEILAAEIVERNELTALLETEREQWGQQVFELLASDHTQELEQLQPLTLLLVAGVQYLLVRSRKIRVYGGLRLDQDATWDLVKQSVRDMVHAVVAWERQQVRTKEDHK